jgi:hypothetical protein
MIQSDLFKALPELLYDDEKHYYRVGGKFIRSVSHYLKPISTQVYGTIDEAILKAAAARGTAVHFAIEIFANYGAIEIAPELQGYFNAFLDWCGKYSPKILASEYRTYHPIYWYAGTLDLIVEINGRIILVDAKCTAELKSYLVSLQDAAYAEAASQHGIRIDGIAALHLRRDGTYTFEEYNQKEAFNMFLSCMTVQNYLNRSLKK